MRPATSGEPAAGARPGNPGRRRVVVGVSVGLLVVLAVLPALPGVGDSALFTLTLMLTSVAVAVKLEPHRRVHRLRRLRPCGLVRDRGLHHGDPDVTPDQRPADRLGRPSRHHPGRRGGGCPGRGHRKGHHAPEGPLLLHRPTGDLRSRPGDREGFRGAHRGRGGADPASLPQPAALLLHRVGARSRAWSHSSGGCGERASAPPWWPSGRTRWGRRRAASTRPVSR